MSQVATTELQTLIATQMATGRYASEEALLLRALRSLADYDESVADIQEGLEDEAAGRLRPLDDVDAEILAPPDLTPDDL